MAWTILPNIPAWIDPLLTDARVGATRTRADILVADEDYEEARAIIAGALDQYGTDGPRGGVLPAAQQRQTLAAPPGTGADAPVPPPQPGLSREALEGWGADRGGDWLRQREARWSEELEKWAEVHKVRLEVAANAVPGLAVRRGKKYWRGGSFNVSHPGAVGLVLFGTAYAVEAPVVMPSSINLRGKPFKLLGTQAMRVEPSWNGTVLHDDTRTIPLVEVINRTIYILFAITGGHNDSTFRLLRTLMAIAVKSLGDVKAQARAAEQQTNEYAVREYRQFRFTNTRKLIDTAKREVAQFETQIQQMGQQLIEKERTRFNRERELDGLLALVSSSDGAAEEEVKHLLEIEHVQRITIDGDRLVVYTDDLQIKTVPVGRFVIRIKATGEVEIRNLTMPMVHDGRTVDHPHVTAGVPCWGNIKLGISQLLGRGQYVEAVQVMLSYLQTYNADDGYGRRFKHWSDAWAKLKKVAKGNQASLTDEEEGA